MQRLYTALKDKEGWTRDLIANPVITTATAVDLSEWLGPVRNQGNEGACTMFAGSGIAEWNFKKYKSLDVVLSPQFGYRLERNIEGDNNVDGGAQSRTMMQVLTGYGLCLEATDPYVDTGWNKPTTAAQIVEARKYRLGAYHRIPDLLTLKSVLASGYVASLAITVYTSFESDEVTQTGLVPLPGSNDVALGGHEIYAYGYDDAIKTASGTGGLKMRNSWGTDWGIAGDFILPYEYWPYVNDSWTAHLGAPWIPKQIAA
jgi:C1A family cysteine protease